MRLLSIFSAAFLLYSYVSAGDCSSCLESAANTNDAIRAASIHGDLLMVKKLLSRPGVDPTANNNEAIRYASRNGRLEVVKELLSRPGVDPSVINNEAIRMASRYGHLQVVRELLSRHGVDPTANNNEAIRWASRNGYLQVVKELLLRPGVDPTGNNNEAIRYASLNGHLEVVKELLSWPGVDPTVDTNIAIRWASANGHLEVVNELLSRPEVDPTANNNEAFRWASAYGHLEVVKELLSRPEVDPAAQNNEAIRHASLNGRLEVVKVLLSSSNVDPSALESQSLEWAFDQDRYEVVQLLIKDGRVDPTINNLALFAKAKRWSQNPSLKGADRKVVSEIDSLLEQNPMVRSILFIKGQQHLTPTRFLEMINFEKAWIHNSYMKSVLKFPQVSKLLSGILGIDRAAADQITTLERLNEEMVKLMKSLDMNDRNPLARKRLEFIWRYFGALREYSSEDKISIKKKGTRVLGEDAELGDNAKDHLAKTEKDNHEDNASLFNYLTVWKLQNM